MLGTVEVDTPLVDHPLPGSIYLARQDENPFNSIFAIYLVVDDPATGVLIKLAGKLEPDRQSGPADRQFRPEPTVALRRREAPLLRGRHRSPFATPATCGTKTTTSELTPWTAPEGAGRHPERLFPDRPRRRGLGLRRQAKARNRTLPASKPEPSQPPQGTYSPFVLRLHREDGTQRFKGLDLTLPKGLIGKLAGIPYCPDAQIAAAEASAGTLEQQSPSCPAASGLGTITVASGAGPMPADRPWPRLPRRPLQGRAALDRHDHARPGRPVRPRHRGRPRRHLHRPRNRPDPQRHRNDPPDPRRRPTRRPQHHDQPRSAGVHAQPDQLQADGVLGLGDLAGRRRAPPSPPPSRPKAAAGSASGRTSRCGSRAAPSATTSLRCAPR